MTENGGIILAGCSAGAAVALASAACGYMKATAKSPVRDEDFLNARDGAFVSARGEKISLRGINMNDDLLFYQKEDLPFPSRSYDVFSALKNRFGAYGALELVKEYEKNFIKASDIKYVARLGANCVRLPLRYYYIFRKESCSDEPDFERLGRLVNVCKKAGLYVIFDLHSAPGFQNKASAGGRNCKSALLDSGTAGFEARNAAIRFWTKLSARFKDEPAVAAYNLLNRPLEGMASREKKLNALYGFYRRAYDAIRNAGDRHVIIFEAVRGSGTFPKIDGHNLENAAYGCCSLFQSRFETDSFVKRAKAEGDGKTLLIVCKARAGESLEYSLNAMNGAGISWLAGDYKGWVARSAFLFTARLPEADLTYDSYETIRKKWSSPLGTKNFTENKEAAAEFRAALKGNEAGAGGRRRPSGPKIKVGVGFKSAIGTVGRGKTA